MKIDKKMQLRIFSKYTPAKPETKHVINTERTPSALSIIALPLGLFWVALSPVGNWTNAIPPANKNIDIH